MNGFTNKMPQQVSNLDGSNPRLQSFDPEHANQFEVGLKTNLYKDIVSATISYYDIDVKDKVITDPANFNNAVQGGAVFSRGFEVSLTANPAKGLNLIAGFSNNKSEVTNEVFENTGYLGLRPEEAGPETLINFWGNYAFQEGNLKGFGIGFGGNYASEYKVLNRSNIGTFQLPSYIVVNSVVSYNTNKFNISLKVNNLFNEKYFSGWSTITPQKSRSLKIGRAHV